MKHMIITFIILAVPIFSGSGQVTSAGQRGFQVQFFEDENTLLTEDYREGILTPVEDVIFSSDSISAKFLGQYWNFSDALVDAGSYEYLPVGQRHDNWTEIITIMRIDQAWNRARKVYEELKKIREERCPGATIYSKILEESKHELLYESRTENCPGFEDQSEIKIIFVPQFDMLQHTIWIVEYTMKWKDITPQRRGEVINWLQDHTFLNNRELQPYLEKMNTQ